MQKYLVLGFVLSVLGCVWQTHAMDGSVAAVAANVKRSGVNVIDDDGDTPLHKAVKRGDVAGVRWLLDLGADPNISDAQGHTSLHYVYTVKSLLGHIGMAKRQKLIPMLYCAGADDPTLTHEKLQSLPWDSRKAVYSAGIAFRQNMRSFCEMGDEENPLTLLSKLLFPGFAGIVKGYVGGPDDVKDDKLVYIHPLQLRITKLLGLENAATQAISLWRACGNGSMRGVLESLFAGADSNSFVSEFDQKTCLHRVMKNGSAEIVRLLLANRATVNVQDEYGNTPLCEAAHFRRDESVDLLLAHNAKVDVQGENGWTALYEAVVRGDNYIVRLLLAHDADIEIPNEYGRTPLQFAQIMKRTDTVKLLKAHKAQMKKKAKRGQEQKQCCVVS